MPKPPPIPHNCPSEEDKGQQLLPQPDHQLTGRADVKKRDNSDVYWLESETSVKEKQKNAYVSLSTPSPILNLIIWCSQTTAPSLNPSDPLSYSPYGPLDPETLERVFVAAMASFDNDRDFVARLEDDTVVLPQLAFNDVFDIEGLYEEDTDDLDESGLTSSGHGKSISAPSLLALETLDYPKFEASDASPTYKVRFYNRIRYGLH